MSDLVAQLTGGNTGGVSAPPAQNPPQITQNPPAQQHQTSQNPQPQPQVIDGSVDNQARFTPPNQQQQSQIDPVQSIINGLVSNPDQQQPQGQQNPPNQQQQIQVVRVDANGNPVQERQQSPAQQFINEFIDIRDLNSFTDNIDREQLQERIAQGDIDGLMDALNQTGQAVAMRVMEQILGLMPEMARSIQASAVRDMQGVNRDNQLWTRFVGKYPEFENYQHIVAPNLIKAARDNSQADFDTIAQAVRTLHIGVIQSPNGVPVNGQNHQQPQGNGGVFDVDRFLQA